MLFIYNDGNMGVKDALIGRLLGNAGKFTDAQVAQTLQLLIEHGIKRGASDIHIEPHSRYVLVRYRIDGALRGIHKLPATALEALMSKLKDQAGLDINESYLPQDGHYSVPSGENSVEVRVSVMPILGGEKAVLHLTQARTKPIELETIGFWGEGLTLIQEGLTHPHGLIIVAGPKHSGVSTTLHSLVSMLNNPMVSIATIEEHVRHRIPGSSQAYSNPRTGLGVLHNLQAALRQDPNIIMLNPLTDKPTAELAVHAAVTGHLLLVGLHADSAVSSILRLKAIGMESFLLASAIRLSVSQRLVRRLCLSCREHYTPTQDELRELGKAFGISTAAAMKKLHELELEALRSGLGKNPTPSTTPGHIAYLWRARPEGCQACDHTGYQGRLAITEVLKNSDQVQKALMSGKPLSEADLHATALKDGFIPLALDGLIKALRGETTIAELKRILALH